MTCYQEILCPECGGNRITKSGRLKRETQRYRCQNKAYMPGVKRQVVEIAVNGGGVRDTGRMLGRWALG